MEQNKLFDLQPMARRVVKFAQRNGGTVSAREAYLDLDITSASLSRRIVDIERAGYNVQRERRHNPLTGKRYTRYHISA